MKVLIFFATFVLFLNASSSWSTYLAWFIACIVFGRWVAGAFDD